MADLQLAPIIFYLGKFPEGKALLPVRQCDVPTRGWPSARLQATVPRWRGCGERTRESRRGNFAAFQVTSA
jgi:hypothetical protein